MKKLFKFLITSFFLVIFSFGLFTSPAKAVGVYDLPTIASGEPVWVIDQAESLSRDTQNKLNNTLKNLATDTGNELRMVTIRRLDYGETMDKFADDLFNTWFPTPETKSNQVLVIIDTLTNKTAIRLGDKFNQLLPITTQESIVNETIYIPLKELQYNQALLNGGDRLVSILSGKDDPGPPIIKEISVEGTFSSAEETNDRIATIWVVVLLIVATVIPMVTYYWYVNN